ncbi:CBS domain-containing protein [Oceanibium sediminis]|uniref:CBS domain-containing protein n=1 Tax=Oceanibium sediminis TaxID=2026339 RepID=UPI000DD47A1E|nr:CBS domain-containing protein [Oceanibium sediminis]
MACVQEILESKPREIHTLASNCTVLEALELMAREDIGAIPVLDNGRLEGIFTERLYARNVFLKGRDSPKTLLKDVMVRDVITVTPDGKVEECMALMSDKRIRHLPVIRENSVVGIVSIGDLMKSIIQERELDIEHLVNYINR